MAVIDYTADIQKLYVAYFNRPADYEGLAFWNNVLNNNGGDLAFVSATFADSKEYADQNVGKSFYQIVNQIYQNLFNRDADVQGLEFWAGHLRNGTFTVDEIVKVIADNASDTDAQDKTTYANKVEAATKFTAELNTASEIIGYSGDAANNAAKTWLSTVSTTASLNAAIAPTALASTVASVAAVGLQSGGKATSLTVDVDNLTGTSGTDVFSGVVNGDKSTFSALDSIDGGAGVDVLNISAIEDFAIPGGLTINNVEQVVVTAAKNVGAFAANGTGALDLSVSMADVDELTVSKAAAADFKAGSATSVKVVDVVGGVEVVGGSAQSVSSATQGGDIQLSGSTGAINVVSAAQGANDITINGGSTVNVAATSKVSSGDIAIGTGVGGAKATGAVTVTANLNSDGTGANLVGGKIDVVGGSTVNVTVNAVSNAKDQAANFATSAGAVTVTGDGKTTSVTVDQTKTVTNFTKAAVAEVKETSVVTFGALKANESVTVGGLQFVASKDLTADQVAAAFANLTNSDTQTATGPVANGYYVGSLSAVWSSAAAAGASVTFTANTSAEANIVASTSHADTKRAVTQVDTDGKGGTPAVKSTNAVSFGAVVIDDNATAAITNVSLNGFASATIGGVAALDALKTISLANSGGATAVTTKATSLDLTVNAVKHAVDLDVGANAVATLKINTTGADSKFALDAADVKDMTIAGDKSVDLSGSTLTALETVTVTGGAGATLTAAAAKSVTTTGTTGTVTAVITGATATYTGGAGVDNVTVNGVATKAINLGAGDDSLTVTSSTAMTVEANGGEGTDTLIMSAVDAEDASKGSTFEGKIASFEKLQVNAVANGATKTVDMSNMDDINYIISAGTNAVAQKSTVTITGGTDNALDTLSVNVGGKTFTVTGAFDAANAATALAAAIDLDAAYTASAASGVITITGAGGTPFTVDTFAVGNNGSPADTAASTDADTATADATTAQVTQVTVTGGVNNVADEVTLKVGGVDFTITGALTAADIATALAAEIDADPAYTATAASGVITITAAVVDTAFAVDALAVANKGGVPDTATAAFATSAASGGIAGTLALTEVAAGATLELTGGAVTGTSVELADATGTADVLKVITKVGAADINYGTLTAEDVETINITATDTVTSATTAINTSALTLKDAALKSVVVDGNGALNLALDANVVALTSVDGTAMTGSLTATTNGTVGQTIKGGSGDDVLTSKATGAVADRLEGGAGDDHLYANKGMTMMLGGEGKDTFHIDVASTNVNSAATIGDLGSGDVIMFAGADAFKSAAISLDSTAVFQDFANAAIASITSDNDLAWFQYGGNTYIVQERDAGTNADVFTNNQDFIVKITGTVDLSTASFNTAGILEIA